MIFLKAIEGFVIFKLASGASLNTTNVYQTYLTLLAKRLNNPDVADITPSDLEWFMAWLSTEYVPVRVGRATGPLRPSSLANTWSAIRSFWHWYDDEFHTGRPDLKLTRPRVPEEVVQPFSEDEARALVRAAEVCTIYPKTERQSPYKQYRQTGPRNTAIVLALLDTGVRVSELCRFKVKDADLTTGEVTVAAHGSGQKTKSRHVYLGKAARRAVWRYLSERDDVRPDDPLFLTIEDRPFTRLGIRSLLQHIGRRAKVHNTHPHRFRHTFAVQFLRGGGDVFTLRRMLGHSSWKMVNRYLALADSDDAEAHRKASPADRWHL